METTPKRYEIDFAGKKLILETGKFANLATAAVTAYYGDSAILVTACIGDEPREGIDYFPLMVDYEERLYAAGKISGSRFIKRETRPSENAVLTARLIDRPLRPLFAKNFRNDVQVIATVLSYDKDHDPDVIAIIASSAALMLTHAPFEGPIAAARVGLIDDKLVLNPSFEELERSSLDLVVAGTTDKVIMLEAGVANIADEKVIEAISFAQASFAPIIALQQEMAADTVKVGVEDKVENPITIEVNKFVGAKLKEAIKEADKVAREAKLAEHEQEVLANFEGNFKQSELKDAFATIVEKEVRKLVTEQGKRIDGRAMDEVRPISVEVDLLSRVHGSALFTRGQTQALTIATLGSPSDSQMIDTMEEDASKRYMHHYNFPPFSTGEVKPLRGASRRDIGHGALAERALEPVIPSKEEFPYTIRLVSEILSSNGSSSMAATCGSTLALMAAGVPISAPVAGVAIGLFSDEHEPNKYRILTDIQGVEDFGGDMDFKVTGTKDGVTAIQMDTKTKGLTAEIVKDAMAAAKAGRLHILEKMASVLPAPRAELSKYAPRITALSIDQAKIGELIGPGGKTIRKIVEECGGADVLTIDIEEDGTVLITSVDGEASAKAQATISAMMREFEVGEIIEGTVLNIQKDRISGKEIGAIVELGPKTDGMVHISQIANERIANVSDRVKPGDKVRVKIVEIDKERGRISLSMKALSEEQNDSLQTN